MTPDFAHFSEHMVRSAYYLGGALRFSLGPHFEQRYPAYGPQPNAAHEHSSDVANTYEQWRRRTADWRAMSEYCAVMRRNKPPSFGGEAA